MHVNYTPMKKERNCLTETVYGIEKNYRFGGGEVASERAHKIAIFAKLIFILFACARIYTQSSGKKRNKHTHTPQSILFMCRLNKSSKRVKHLAGWCVGNNFHIHFTFSIPLISLSLAQHTTHRCYSVA